MHYQQKYGDKNIFYYIDKKCEQCGKEHDHTYGIGRFCSKHCSKQYINQCGKNSPKRKEFLDRLHKMRRKHEGKWKCKICDSEFETREQLHNHIKEVHYGLKYNKVRPISDNNVDLKCPFCDKHFTNYKALNGHLASCPKHPNKEYHDQAHKQSGATYKRKVKEGKYM